jgi:ADP-ribose pyrophosphatase
MHRGAPYAWPMSDADLVERTVEEHTVDAGSYLTYKVLTVQDHTGARHTRQMIVHPGAVTIVAVEGADVLMVRQYRTPAAEVLLELPAGTLDRLPDGTIEDPALAAPRELGEETGFHAARWRHMGSFFTAPGFTNELMHLYLATGLEPIAGYAGPEPDEHLELMRMPIAEAVSLAESGGIRDAKSIAGLFWVQRLIDRGELELATASE